MAQQRPTITFEDISLEQARCMTRGPRMDPRLYRALREKIQSLGSTATRITLLDGTSPTAMKNQIGVSVNCLYGCEQFHLQNTGI